MVFFASFLVCFSLRFSFNDFPTFFVLCWFGDLSAMVDPLVVGVVVRDVEISSSEQLQAKASDFP